MRGAVVQVDETVELAFGVVDMRVAGNETHGAVDGAEILAPPQRADQIGPVGDLMQHRAEVRAHRRRPPLADVVEEGGSADPVEMDGLGLEVAIGVRVRVRVEIPRS